ncbi:MAG: 4Fe-4S dicluster domain-containing protein [Gemmatimonadetes bacterium]|nr:4Fe-4S dicluster domain-containing protein [Gemmatimonadota bacterium]
MPEAAIGEEYGTVSQAPSRITEELLAACVHCGFCVPVCPTWDILREENDSPRGRLYLMLAEADGRVDPAGAFAVHLDRCLGCRACESVCPAGVPYGHLLEQARARIRRRPATRRRQRWVLSALTRPDAARLTYAAARFLRSTGLAGGLGRLLPGRAGQLLRLLAATRPAFGLGASSLRAQPPRLGDDPPDKDDDRETYALLTGCVMEGLFEHVHAATRRSLARSGYDEVEAPGQACCGALHAHAGQLDEARQHARRNIEAFERTDCDWVVTNSAGCGAGLKDYPAWFAQEPDWLERAEALTGRVRDVTEILAVELERSGGGSATAGATRAIEGRVGYDAPCHLHHAQGVLDQPLDVLRALPGLEVEALPSSAHCCGGAGMYNLEHPELADLVRATKLGEIQRGGYDWIATGNPGCIMYLGAGLLRAGDRTPVVHPVELVDRAWG